MKNTKRKGTIAEREARDMLEADGYLVVRSGASITVIDLVCIKENEIKLLQIKAERKSKTYPADTKRLREVKVGKTVTVSKELWIRKDYKGWTRIPVNDDEPGTQKKDTESD